MTEARLKCGDIARHRPTGERWVVAYADYESGDLAWTGWPEGRARIADCDLIRSCNEAEHIKWLQAWLRPKRKNDDHRPGVIRRLYGATEAGRRALEEG